MHHLSNSAPTAERPAWLERRAAAPAALSALACWRFLWLNSITAAVSVGVAVIVGTTSGPLAAVALILGSAVAIAAASLLPITRRLAAGAFERKRRRERVTRREERLERAGSSRQNELAELHGLIDDVEAADPYEHARLELDELVDRYVDVAVAIEGFRRATRASSGLEDRGDPDSGSTGERLRHELVRRRRTHRDECRRRARELEGELEAILELVRLIAERTACPAADDLLDRQVERRLWELDARDSALRQLGSEGGAELS